MTTTRALVDCGATLFLFLAFVAIALWLERRDSRRLLVLAGLLGGLGISTKYTAGWLWVLELLLVAWAAWRPRRALRDALAAAILPGLVSFAVIAPWLVKSLVYTGNPVFPFLFSLFGGRNWDAATGARFAAYNAGMGAQIGWRNLYELVPELFFREGTLENSTLGPLFLLAAPFLLLRRGRPAPVLHGLALGLLYLPYWYFSARILRYLVLVAPFFALAAADAFTDPALSRRGRRLFQAAVLVALAVNLRQFVLDEVVVFEPFRVAAGLEGRDDYLGRKLQSYNVMRHVNEALPRSARVFSIGETAGYHLQRDHVTNSAHDRSILQRLIREEGDAGAVARRLRELGVTHLLYHPAELERLRASYGYLALDAQGDAVLRALLETQARPLMRGNGVWLFELRPAFRPGTD
jgi:hypothetical protein